MSANTERRPDKSTHPSPAIHPSLAASGLRHWALLLILAGIQFTHVLDFVLIMPLAPHLMRVMSVSPGAFGLLVSNYNLAAAVAGLIGAFFLDRFDRKRSILVIYFGFTLGTLACGLANDYYPLLIARIVAGAFGGLLQALIFTIIGDYFVEKRRGAATGTVMSAFSVASVLGVPFGLFLADLHGWQFPFLLLAAVSTLILLGSAWLLPPLRAHMGPEHGSISFLRTTFSLLVEKNTMVAFSLIILLMFAGFSVIPFISAYLVANVGMKESELAYVFFAGGVATLISSRLIGRVADHLGKARVFSWLALLSIAPIFLLTNLPHVSLPAAIAVTTLFTVLVSARGIPALALITSSVEPRRRGSFLSLTSAVQQAASGMASLAAGSILGRSADGEITRYGVVGLLAAGATLLSIGAARNLKTRTGS